MKNLHFYILVFLGSFIGSFVTTLVIRLLTQ